MKTTTLTLLAAVRAAAVAGQEPTTVPYKACAVPGFEWATYSTSTTARMYGMRGAYSAGFVYAAGFVKSTLDASTPAGLAGTGRFTLQGPYNREDPRGDRSQSVSTELRSYTTLQGAKENAGGTWGQYEVGVAKMDAATGAPVALFTWEGDGLDETTGVAVEGNALAVSGHFTGNLTAVLQDGTAATIWNSNIEDQVGGVADNADQFHPNTKDVSGHSGVDDGFVIHADATTGVADWIVAYPKSNKDSQIIDVQIETASGDRHVLAAGYRCHQDADAAAKTCDGIVALLDAADGSPLWETVLPHLGAVLRLAHDPADDAVYATGTTTYAGLPDAPNNKDHPGCDHATCAVALRLDGRDGTVAWERTLGGSPRWGVFGQNGGVGLAAAADGPYVYVALDDAGEGAATSLDAGTPYAGCKDDATGAVTPEYEVSTERVVGPGDCPAGSAYVARDAPAALPAATAETGVACGDAAAGAACVAKYHKHTGLPVWAHDAPDVSGLVPAADGSGVHVGGWYSSRGGIPVLGGVALPGYLREEGLDGSRGGIYNAKIDAATGRGAYAVSSGGGNKDRLNDLVGDAEGDVYVVGYQQNLVMRWGADLTTEIAEDQGAAGPNPDNPTQAVETQICVSKMRAAAEAVPDCLTTCSGSTDDATIAADACFIDGQCYAADESTVAFGRGCDVCAPAVSQRAWTPGPTIGAAGADGTCVIDGACVPAGTDYYYQRRAWNSPRVTSACRHCDPVEDAYAWSVKAGFAFNASAPIPPADCVAAEEEEARAGAAAEEQAGMAADDEGLGEEARAGAAARSDGDDADDAGLGGGAIVGILLGAVVVVALVGMAVLKSAGKDKNKNEAAAAAYDPTVPPPSVVSSVAIPPSVQ